MSQTSITHQVLELVDNVKKKLTDKQYKDITEDNAQRCLKCDTVVPNDFWKKGWAECLHTGVFCPRHSPTCNCGDMECYCCNKKFDAVEE